MTKADRTRGDRNGLGTEIQCYNNGLIFARAPIKQNVALRGDRLISTIRELRQLLAKPDQSPVEVENGAGIRIEVRNVFLNVIVGQRQPWFGRRKSCAGGCVPLHRRAAPVA